MSALEPSITDGDERVPVRVEIGPRDLKNNVATIVRRDTGKKETAPLANIVEEVRKRFLAINESLLEKAATLLRGRIKDCNTLEDVKKISRGYCKNSMVRKTGMRTFDGRSSRRRDTRYPGRRTRRSSGKCPVCGKETENMAIMAKTY